ncbi:MAG: tetratricopeptide repeat protein [Usitatibacter sp.]
MSATPPAASKEFRRAVSLFQQGRLDMAERVFADLYARAPNDAELAQFGGVLANRMGRHDTAVERLTRCVRLDPRRARAHAALAFAHDALGRTDDSRRAFEDAVRADPAFAEAHNGLGIAHFRLGEPAAALANFERALALNPRFVEARLNAARALHRLGQREAAARRFAECLPLAGDHEEVLRQVALGLYYVEAFEPAAEAMARILESHPEDAATRGRRAHALDMLGRADEARVEIDAALAAASAMPDLHNVRGALLQRHGEWNEAAAAYLRAVELDPRHADALINLAVALRQLGRPAESRARLDEARLVAGGDAAVTARLATLYGEAGESAIAIELFESALRIDPHAPGPRGLYGTELLRAGDLVRGWKEYVYRPTRGGDVFGAIAQGAYPPVLPRELRDRDIVIVGEQGLGDILFFLRYAQPLAAAGARLHVRADRRLEPLVRRAMPIAGWLDDDAYPRGAIVAWAGDLPAMTAALAGPVAPSLRIAPLPDRVEKMRATLPARGLPLVGIAWQAGTPLGQGAAGHHMLLKEVPEEAFGRALAKRSATYVSIQRNAAPASRERLAAALGGNLHDRAAANDDLEDMLALLSLLDDYVGVSSTNVHLLAALGGSGRILVPHPAEWRWQLRGERSPWFPRFTIHRQEPGGDWSRAFDTLQGETS